jgi:hypothetical protein
MYINIYYYSMVRFLVRRGEICIYIYIWYTYLNVYEYILLQHGALSDIHICTYIYICMYMNIYYYSMVRFLVRRGDQGEEHGISQVYLLY